MNDLAFMRVQKNTNYSVISNIGLRDDRLSWKARGILSYLLSLPEDWKIYESEVANHAPDGRTSFRSGMKELEKCGYITKERINSAGGKFEYQHTIWESPCTGFPHTVNPSTVEPNTVEPHTDNETLLSTDSPSTDELSTDEPKNKTEQQAAPKSDYSTEFESFWTSYPRKVDKKQAYRKWKEALKNHTAEDIMSGVAGYNQHIKKNKTETTYIKHAKTFLGNESFKEYEVTAGHESSGEQLKQQYNLPF